MSTTWKVIFTNKEKKCGDYSVMHTKKAPIHKSRLASRSVQHRCIECRTRLSAVCFLTLSSGTGCWKTIHIFVIRCTNLHNSGSSFISHVHHMKCAELLGDDSQNIRQATVKLSRSVGKAV